ncbi:MAG TPA: hypothetical protein VNA69_04485 [Thermoanaerobaculia bacterium]|nr:hypothetical protein [Thermoanaerobaculia bacterium]
MLKPVTILALDDVSAPLAAAVQQRVAAACGLDDLVQTRELAPGADLAQTIQSVHAQRQRPDSPLRVRDDVSSRELVLLILSAAGPARTTLLETTIAIRQLYEMRRLAAYFTIEILCLLPEVVRGVAADYAAAYGLLEALSATDPKPFDEVWLLDATNANRVKFGSVGEASDFYAGAIAGALTAEPEMSGALPGIHPRGMPPVFSSFGYAQLVFPRDAALQRLEPRFAAELIHRVILSEASDPRPAPLRAKQFVVGEEFATPLSRIGVDAGQSLFRRFQPRTLVTEQTRSAEEVIAAVRSELKTYRETTHLENLETLAKQGEETAAAGTTLLSGVTDETLDRDGYESAIQLLDALLDPLPDLRADADLAPRNLVTEINNATAALDVRLGFLPNTSASDAARKRIREVTALLQDQRLVADTLSPISATEQLEEMEREKEALTRQLPETLFAEEAENNAARNAARETEAARLSSETEAGEQQLRELFAQLPRAEQALREALEARRAWIRRQVITAVFGLAVLYAVPFAFGVLQPNLGRITWVAAIALGVFAILCLFRYLGVIAPHVRAAREALEHLRAQIETTDKAKNAAHNDELQFEYDVAHRRTTLNVLRRAREAAKSTLDTVRTRKTELQEMAASFAPAPLPNAGLSIPIVDEADVDQWYERTAEDRGPFVREFPLTRSESRRWSLDELRARITAYAATAFDDFRALTLAQAATLLVPQAKLSQRLKRFAETSAPMIELREDDLPAQQAMQRDLTLWIDVDDGPWANQMRHRLPNAHVKAAADSLRVHSLSRVLHYPGYVLGQIDYYRAEYEKSSPREGAEADDLLPMDLILAGPLRAAYEQVLLGRALGVIDVGDLGDSHLAAARRLASNDAAALREQVETALAPRLSLAADVERELRQFRSSAALSPLDRGVLDALVKRYASAF